jgi:hypothetical protein
MKQPFMLAGLALFFISNVFAQSTNEKPALIAGTMIVMPELEPGDKTEAINKALEDKSQPGNQNTAGHIKADYEPNAGLYSWVFGEVIHNALNSGQSGDADTLSSGPLKMTMSKKNKANPGC